MCRLNCNLVQVAVKLADSSVCRKGAAEATLSVTHSTPLLQLTRRQADNSGLCAELSSSRQSASRTPDGGNGNSSRSFVFQNSQGE
jgi:hypothetical protein